MVIDGEVQADFALNPEMLKEKFPFSKLAGKKSILDFSES
jgi:malate dehydrogenase (oxaloacetate-decarboxylating)(NADP+)